jgi:tetratricopeptide (TPR) repeat protein
MLCLASTSQIRAADVTPSYDDTLAKARKLTDDGKLAEAYLTGSAAISMDEKRWEAYGMVALVMNAQGATMEAKAYLDKAIARAPEARKVALGRIGQKFSQAPPSSSQPANGSELTGEARRKLNVLMLSKGSNHSFVHQRGQTIALSIGRVHSLSFLQT